MVSSKILECASKKIHVIYQARRLDTIIILMRTMREVQKYQSRRKEKEKTKRTSMKTRRRSKQNK